jgi:hypothetical protein
MLQLKNTAISSLLVLSIATVTTTAFAQNISFGDESDNCLNEITGTQDRLLVDSPSDIRKLKVEATTSTPCPVDNISMVLSITNSYENYPVVPRGLLIIGQSGVISGSNTDTLYATYTYSATRVTHNDETDSGGRLISNYPHCLYVSRTVTNNGITANGGDVIHATSYDNSAQAACPVSAFSDDGDNGDNGDTNDDQEDEG